MPASSGPSFYEVLNAAMSDMAEHGFDSVERVALWQRRLREALERMQTPQAQMEQMIRRAMVDVYKRVVDRGGALTLNPGVNRFTLDRLRPDLRAEMERHIFAAADLIVLNRPEEIAKTLRRFSGWATSIPAGGGNTDKREAKEHIKKGVAGLKFRERRVLIDQGHKLTSALSETMAVGSGALAGIWHSHWKQANYDYREEHKERDGLVYVVKGNWALERGLMKTAGRPYTDDVTKPGEEVFCRCQYQWLFNLRSLPKDMLTKKGEEELARVRAEIAA